MDLFVAQVITGLLIGSTYALVGLGFTFVWGIMQKFNLAYGANALGGGYAAIVVYQLAGPGWLALALALGAALVAGALLGLLIELCSFRFLPRTYELAPLLSTLGVMFVVTEGMDIFTKGVPQAAPNPLGFSVFRFEAFMVRQDLLFIAAMAVAIIVALHYFTYRTTLGLATRAVSQHVTAAQLCGIGVNNINIAVFVLTGTVAGAAGIMLSAAVGQISSLLAMMWTGKGLIVAIIGGLGSFRGAIAGGLLLGVVEFVALGFLGVRYRDIIAFLLLFIFLVVRPTGLFGDSAAK